jgi:hypothetical protein
MNDIGKQKWHRVFGWVTITHPYTQDGHTLADSQHKHVQHYVSGKGWVDYIGEGPDGKITSIFLHKDELFDEEQKDSTQSLMRTHLFKILE